jgi:phosphatidylglycerol---prolipoprotein diacylglyceryl transferase
MLPSLFTFGSFSLHTYGLMLAIGFLTGIYISAARAKKAGEDPALIWDLSVWVILSAILGARLFYVVLNFDEFRGNLLSIINPVQADGTLGIGGLVFIGGFILALFVTVLYLRKRKRSLVRLLDICVPGAAIGMGIGRIGCFLNGCCYGLPTALPWGISFPESCPAGAYAAAMHAHLLHPAQLYMVLGGLLTGGLLLLLERYKRFDGFTLLLYLMFYSVDRTTVDFFRYYPPAELHFGLSHNQWILGLTFAVSAVLFVRRICKSRKMRATAPIPSKP